MGTDHQPHTGQRFNRLLSEDSQQAQALLASSEWLQEESVHQFRLCIKRLRAGWRMLRAPAYKHHRHSADRVLKTAAQALGGKRDADVRLTTWRRLRADAKPAEIPLFDQLEALLRNHAAPASPPASPEALSALLGQEEAIRADANVERCRWRELKEGRDWAAEKNRLLAQKALGGEDQENYHRWRRWAKHLLYQRLLAATVRGHKLGKRQQTLNRLATELGRKHDLDMLATFLANTARSKKQQAAHRALLPVIASTNRRYQARISKLYRSFNKN
ncbi:CHAD domain-containing protein [Motiliproteus sp. SC1-56]|uniref:CHAD domain-containing protein n=1 Tax=Motiliproteus sp. SC1-56 TaxID=2799565 RepID=UPI001A8CB2D6|nr:CHAD domain-containing protein [Motiliproteus sp. SC1-56]